jgi:parvulin-like peptidyl-prolyl isomerase
VGRAGGRRPLVLLGAGGAAGLALAALGLLDPGDAGLPPGAVATVNGEPILAQDLERTLAALAADRREPLDADDRRHVLERLVDEELLVQRGLALGLVRHDRRVRADLTRAMIEAALAEVDGTEPTREELLRHLREQSELFVRPGRLHVRQVFVRASGEGAEERAHLATVRLRAGEPLEAVAAALGDAPVVALPDAPLPALKLREYLGPTALRAAHELEVGGVADPVRSGMGFHVLVLVAREPDRLPELEQIEDEVRADWLRRRDDRALRDYLEELRREAEVRVAPEPR